MSKFFLNFDLIASDLGFNYKGFSKYNTMLGATFSIITIVFTIIGLFYFGMELFKKENPILISSTNYNQFPSNTSLSPTNFPFYLAVADRANNLEYFKDDKVFELTGRIYNRMVSVDENGKSRIDVIKTPIKLEDCKIEKHFPGTEDGFKKDLLSKAYCIRPEDNLFIKGDYNVDEFYELQFYVTPCYNTTENKNKCRSQEEIDKRIDNSYVRYKFGYYYYSPKNFSNPLTRETKDYFPKVSTSSMKKQFSYIKIINFKTDSGILFENQSTESFTQVDTVYDQLEPTSLKFGDPIWTMDLRMSYNEEQHIRYYLKIQNLLAIIGGLYNGLFRICTLLNWLLFRHYFWIDLLKDNFRITQTSQDDKNSVENKNCKMNSSIFHHKSELPMVNPFIVQTEPQKINTEVNVKSKKNMISEKLDKLHLKNSFEINIKQYIKSFFLCCLYKKKKLKTLEIYWISRNYLTQLLDINTIISNHIEFNRLKYLNLTEEEYALFHYLPKPNILSLSDNKIKDPYFNFITKKEENRDSLTLYLMKLNDQVKQNKSLIQLYDEDIRDELNN